MENTDRVPVTKEGLEELEKELEQLRYQKRPVIAEAIAEARSHGDLRENSAYDAARHDQMMNERRIADLETLILKADVIEEGSLPDTGVVSVGSVVTVDFDGDEERFTLVGAIEAKPSQGKISNESPIGRALIGKQEGDVAEVETPGGLQTLKILLIEQ